MSIAEMDPKSRMKTVTMKTVLTLAIPVLLASSLLPGSVSSQDETVPRVLLIQGARDQSKVLCSSELFTQCMGFNEAQCLELSEQSIEQCLMPLPEQIDLGVLQNETLENCPKKVYDDAGYTDEKALMCLEKAMK